MNRSLAIAAAVLSLASVAAPAASFTPLGVLPGGDSAVASGVSADGAVVVGSSRLISGATPPSAFRWEAGVMTDLGTLPGAVGAFASNVSADGSVIVGSSLSRFPVPIDGVTVYPSNRGFLWSDGFMGGLPGLPIESFRSSAGSISADGSVVVGWSSCSCYGSSGPTPTLWTGYGDFYQLGTIPGGTSNSGQAYGVSADGSVVVGDGNRIGLSSSEAFRWTIEAGMVGLGDLPGGTVSSAAYEVSADGSVIVGQGNRTFVANNLPPTGEAFRWTIEEGMVGLGDLSGGDFSSVAYGVSANGSIVVGQGNGVNGKEAFVWTQEGGMQRLFDVLVAGGATGLDGWTLTGANSISADGNWVVGSGINPFGTEEAFRANIAAVPVPPTVWLLGTGIVGLIRQVRRRRSAI